MRGGASPAGGIIRSLLLALFALVTTACLRPRSISCEDVVCPEGHVCSARAGCLLPEQLSSCKGQQDLAACSYPGTSDGACFGGTCLPAGCGNRELEPEEVCDDGNHDAGDGCSADCTSDETCGNGHLDLATEQCDDGNLVSGDGCQQTCVASVCGDGIVDSVLREQCDDGPDNSYAPDRPCRPDCQNRHCGDGTTDPIDGELCDNGNEISGDGCSADCKSREVCGNSYLDVVKDEQCDDGNTVGHDGCWGGCLLEQAGWTQVITQVPAKRDGVAMAFDARRDRMVVFGGYDYDSPTSYGDTYAWDGDVWTQLAANGPPARRDHAMAYDANRDRIVLMGGREVTGYPLADTWEWDGTSWNLRFPLGDWPDQRTEHAMTYDSHRHLILMHGGFLQSTGTVNKDTFTYDGTTWKKVTPANAADSPAAARGVAMAYDPVRDRTVLFGGYTTAGVRNEVWEWDGMAWAKITPTNTPPAARAGHAMTYDAVRQRVIVSGGYNASNAPIGDTWEWDGASWVQDLTAQPTAHSRGAMAYDLVRHRTIVFGGRKAASVFSLDELWERDDTGWTKRDGTSPAAQDAGAMATDEQRGRIVMFGMQGGTSSKTFEWNGLGWIDMTPASVTDSPSPRAYMAMAYDGFHRVTVLFGGNDGSDLGDTWIWDGSVWSQQTPSGTTPDPRSHHTMAYDAKRRRVVLFAGTNGVADTWEWDGSQWHDVTPAGTSPPPVVNARMAYDAGRQRTVLIGGNVGVATGTWEWDGTAWMEVAPYTVSPVGRFLAAMAYDPLRQKVVLFGGRGDGYRNDVWEWGGTLWKQVLTPTSPPGRMKHYMAFDAIGHSLVLYGGEGAGSSGTISFSDTWRLEYVRLGAPDESCRIGMDSDGDTLGGCADRDCWPQCTPGCPPNAPCDIALPSCGTNGCNPALETCSNCPGDCGACAALCGDFACAASESATTCPGDCL